MKKILLTCAACLAMLASCAQKGEKAPALTEPATITWIADKPGTSLHPHSLFPGVPDSLWNALGLQEGVPTSVSCFLLQVGEATSSWTRVLVRLLVSWVPVWPTWASPPRRSD